MPAWTLPVLPALRPGALWPGRCAHCGARSAEPLCHACRQRDLARRPRCARCGLPIDGSGPVCGTCLLHPPSWQQAVILGDYAFPNDRLVLRMKFGAEPAIGRWLGKLLATRWLEDGLIAPDIVVPVPLSRRRLLERGFNPAWEIARSLAARLHCPGDPTGLLRLRHGATQSGLPLDARRRNVRGAYAADGRFDGRRVLLVDDVLTSGATLEEASRVLLRHGAAGVAVAAALRTPLDPPA